MPIKGLTTNLTPQFPILGKIRKGGAKQNNRFGQDLEHFRFDCNNNIQLQAFLESHYGAEPNNITVQLPFQTVEDNFPCWMEEYNNSGLTKQCDGETIHLHLNEATQQYSKSPISCQFANGCKCKQVGRLKVVLPKIIDLGRIGYFLLETHSKHDIIEINQFLLAIYNSFGSVSGIPMILSRYKREVSTPYQAKDGTVKRTKSIKNLVRLSLHPEVVKKMRSANVLMPVENYEQPQLDAEKETEEVEF